MGIKTLAASFNTAFSAALKNLPTTWGLRPRILPFVVRRYNL